MTAEDDRPSDRKEHKHRHKEHKHKEKDRDRNRDKDRDRERGKEIDSSRERHHASRASDREHKRDRSDRNRPGEEDRPAKRQDRGDSPDANEVDAERHIHADKAEPAYVTDAGLAGTAPSESGAHPDPRPDNAAVNPHVQESGGEVSMSIEETNRVRISLGLKPLCMENSSDTKRKEMEARQKVQREQEQAAEAAALAERIQKKREKRLLDESLRKVKTLGQADEEVDDIAKWVTKSRSKAEEEKELAREEAAAAALKAEQGDEEDEEAQARGLAGLKVKHTADEMLEGETMILTLADKNILDEKGDLSDGEDELENVLAAEHKKRDKARKAASKPASRFEEEQKKKGLLDKYDEEEEEAAMHIGAQGIITDEARKRQEEIRAKLTTIDAKDRPSYTQAKDYYTSEEAAQFQKPKKKMRRKVRAKQADEEGGLDVAALEAEAAAAGSAADRGSRKASSGKQAKAVADRTAEEAKRQSRYDAALDKAKYAALAMRQAAHDEDAIGNDDEDLYESLARARKAAEKQMQGSASSQAESFAEQLASRREQDEAAQAMDTEKAAIEGLEFTEASEFARSIQMREPEDGAKPSEDGYMGVQDGTATAAPTPQPQAAAAPKSRKAKWGSWVAASEEGEEEGALDEEMPDAPSQAKAEPAEDEQSLIREAPIGKGMAGVLGLLKDRGELSQRMQWAGRTNDMKPVMLQGLEEVYQSGGHADQVANRVEMALTRRDEYGRVLTPKQAFREVSYRFHGIEPSKKSKEKIQRKVRDEMAAKKAAGSEQPAGSFNHLKNAQAKTNTPYVVLSGKIRPGQSSDPKSGYATVDSQVALTPVLGGGKTPLTGDRKVEAMLGIRKRAGNDGMPPPPSRLAKKTK